MTPRLDWDADRDSAQRAARVVALHALASVNEARERIRKRDRDSIHDFRVAVRRLRSWMHVFRPVLDDTLQKKTRRRLRRLARATANLRDLDVQIAWLRAERAALGEGRLEAAGWIIRSLRAERKSAWRSFSKTLKRDFQRTSRELEHQLMNYVTVRDVRRHDDVMIMRTMTERAIRTQAEALHAAFERVRSADDTRRLHRSRIIAKRARYVLDAVARQAPQLTATAADLHRFQDVVGELRDAQLLAHRVTREITALAAERTALVASELVYRPTGPMDFSRVVGDSPFDQSLSLLFARLRDRISAAAQVATTCLEQSATRSLVARVEAASRAFGPGAPIAD